MPLYEYQCEACKKVHEVMQKFSDAPLAECVDCKGPVTKLVSLGSFALKGSGWYTTDYKRKGTQDTHSTKDAKAAGGASAAPTSPAPEAKSAAPKADASST